MRDEESIRQGDIRPLAATYVLCGADLSSDEDDDKEEEETKEEKEIGNVSTANSSSFTPSNVIDESVAIISRPTSEEEGNPDTNSCNNTSNPTRSNNLAEILNI